MCNILNLSLFLLAFGFVNSQNDLSCYDCDPHQSVEECESPETRNAPTQKCGEGIEEPKENDGTNKNVTYLCLSSYIQSDEPGASGIIRGCYAASPEVQDVCELLKEKTTSQNKTVKSCHSCNSPKCNTIRLFSDGTSGAESNYFILMMCVNVIFGIIITSTV